jgi:hypothetical protein
MKNWFNVAVPHEDIRNGDFDESVFAADLADVAAGQAAADYNDPYVFYKKTYLTHGLSHLLHQVHDKLASGKGPGVLELKTPFGGGKTHALISLYHYLTNGEQIESLLPDNIGLLSPALATLVGTQLNAAEGETSEGITRYTLWGELAFQLGSKAAYELVKENDKSRVAPGKTLLRGLLEPQQPFVLLFDEVLEYVNRARGVAVKDSTLAAQTRAFFQELTETVASLSNGLMIVTLPSSELEDLGEAEQQNLAKLEKMFGRIESIETPVQGEEVYAIIRKRLFEPIGDESEVKEIVDSYATMYQDHKDELPPKAREADYRRKLETAYPFHPDVIDILYEKWGTFPSFQRTRGVLRLLANVVEDLYQREKNIDLILPGDVNLVCQSVRIEFIKHIGPEYESIIGSDISKSKDLDKNKDWNHLAERIATAIFVHSFAADEPHKGISRPYIKLAVMRPETVPPLVTEVLQKQTNELWYLNTRGEEYYFSDVPNLNRMVLDRKQTLKAEVRPELKRRIQQEFGNKFRCYLWPQSADGIPNNRYLKLVVLDPENAPSLDDLTEWLEKVGSSFRVYKNTIFFALPDPDRYLRFHDAVREYLALKEIDKEVNEGQQPGLKEKKNELKRRIQSLQDDFPLQVRELYRTVAVPVAGNTLETIDLGKPTIGKENLDSWYWKELTDEGNMRILSRPPSARMLSSKFLSTSDAISLNELLEQFYKDTSLPVLADPAILAEAVVRAVKNEQLGVGAGSVSAITAKSVRFGEDIAPNEISFDEDRFLLSAEQAKEKKEEAIVVAEHVAQGIQGIPQHHDEGTDVTTKPFEKQELREKAGVSQEPRIPRYRLEARGIPVGKIADLNRGVLRPLRQEVGDFKIAIQIDVQSQKGISKRVIEQQVKETLRQLGADFE